LREPKYLSLRRAFAVWLGRVVLVRSGMTKNVSECQDLQEVGAMLEERVAEWQHQYRKEGFIAGREEGKAIGVSTALQFILNSKFGSYPPEIQTKISTLTQFEVLETLLPCAYRANSINEFNMEVDRLIYNQSKAQ